MDHDNIFNAGRLIHQYRFSYYNDNRLINLEILLTRDFSMSIKNMSEHLFQKYFRRDSVLRVTFLFDANLLNRHLYQFA
jgi:hypothetical protein